MDNPIFLGLDLGRQADYTALVLLERWAARDDAGASVLDAAGWPVFDCVVRYAQRWPLKTSYPIILTDLAGLLRRPELGLWPHLACDASGVGAAVLDMIVAAGLPCLLTPIVITGGTAVSRAVFGAGVAGFHVPKVDLVACITSALQQGRLKFATGLALGEQLRQELVDFRASITPSAHVRFEARAGQHDDLVLALACGLWLATHQRPLDPILVGNYAQHPITGDLIGEYTNKYDLPKGASRSGYVFRP